MPTNNAIPMTVAENEHTVALSADAGVIKAVSPTVDLDEVTGGVKITVKDVRGERSKTVYNGQDGSQGSPGADGYSPAASVSKSGDTATITITDKNGTTTATVKDGADGQDGAAGTDGYSPSASVSKSGDTVTITITDKNGTTTATVKDGDPGDLIDDTAGAGDTDKTWSADRMSGMETLLEEILSSGDSWAGVQYLVRQGKGATAFPVGTQLRTRKETSMSAALGTHTGITAVSVNEETFLGHEGRIGNGIHEFHYDGAAWIYENQPVTLSDFGITVTGTAKNGDQVIVTEAFTEILWDVVAHKTVDGHPRMVLLMHNCWYNRPFDAIEALYYAEEGLAAGDYHFTIQNYDATYGGNKTYQFTLTEAVPAGGHILLDWPYNQQLLGRSVKTYASKTATTQIESAVLSEGSGGTDLGTTDGNSTNLNHIHRARYGSNNYKESAIRQWLNSAAAAGNWWNSQTKFDLKSGYAGEAGFLHGMDSEFLAAVAESTVKCGTNNTFELPGWTLNTAYTVQEKFYLPSRPEVGLGDETMDQGSVWGFYDGAADTDRIKRDFGSTARYWWLRSPIPSSAHYVRLVYSSGALNSYYAYYGSCAAAACEIG